MTRRSRLPLRITLLLALVLIVTALSAIRLFTAIAWRETLDHYEPISVVVYTAITGAAWTVIGLFVLWCIIRKPRLARWVILAAAAAYATWTWFDRLFVRAQLPANWAFTLFCSALLLAFVAAVALDRRDQSYFGKREP